MVETVSSNVSAFNFMVSRKRHRKYLQAEVIFNMLKEISILPYHRRSDRGRNRKVGEAELVLDILNSPESLDENGTEVNFFVDRETRENYPTRDGHGDFHTRTLPEEENLCFKTHGCFFFKKINEIWVCCLLFERRFHTIGLARLVKYLEKIKPDYSFEALPISTIPNIIKKINKVSNLKSVIIKDQDIAFTPNENTGMGTMLVRDMEERQFSGLNIEIAILQGNTTLEKIKNFFVARWFGKEFNETNLREFAFENDLVLVGKTNSGMSYKVNLFEDLILYKIKVLKLESREINTDDFFVKIRNVMTDREKNKLIKLSRKFYNSVQIEDALQDS